MLKFLKSWIFYIMFVWVLVCQGLFILIQQSFGEKVVDSIQGQLRQELAISNFNFLARSITDFTVSGAIECGVLIKTKPMRMNIVDLRYMARECDISPWALSGVDLDVKLMSLNGDEYSFSFISKNPSLFYFALWGFRILGLIAIAGIAFAVRVMNRSELEVASKMKKLAMEVSHDIRSPLSALALTLKDYPFENREVKKVILSSIERINDIANNLLSTHKEQSKKVESTHILLLPIIHSVISEKRIQFKAIEGLNLQLTSNCSPFTSVQIDQGILHRSLSNIINNAIEAITDNADIYITVSEKDSMITIGIRDFGRGIPSELMEKIGQVGFSTKGTYSFSGSGLGVSSARENLEQYGGELYFDNTHKKGVEVSIILPQAPVVPWLATQLDLGAYDEVWVLDDDPAIHQFWNNKTNLKTRSFLKITEFKEALAKSPQGHKLFLIDYELGGDRSGLQVIDDLELSKNAILVTSVFERKEIQQEVQELGVKMIPKYLLDEVSLVSAETSYYDSVFIDDDSILRLGWELQAKRKKMKLLTLASTSEFDHFSSMFLKEKTKIYIDSNLGVGSLRGEEFAEILYKKGYKYLYLTTGYQQQQFLHLPWLNVLGKVCPF